ncbi:MAG: J domain-containing protein [Cyclobacteriaceae bacterium]
MQDYYSLLEISESASDAEIKRAFKRLALLYHPDKHAGDEQMEEKFKEINEAYQTLSNPYEKARYDIKLSYGRYTNTTFQEPTYTPPQEPIRRNRPSYSEPKIDWKENWRATLYAFGFTFIVASIVMSVFFIRDFYNERKHEQLLSSRKTIFEAAKRDYERGKIESALASLNELSPHLKEEKYMVEFKDTLYASFIDKGESSYYNYQFNNAIYYYELVERFAPRKPLPIKEHLAKAYQFTNNPEASIKVFTELLVLGYRHIDCYMAIGEIYRDQLHNLAEAERYFVLAREVSIKQYRSIYGKAYFLILNGEYLPKHHYTLYADLAQIYLDMELFEKAIKTSEWNIQVWPDSAKSYLIAAKGHLALGQTTEACENFQLASALGYNGSVDVNCFQ